MSFEDIPKNRVKEVCYTSVLCEHRLGKSDPNDTCINIYGTNVKWDGYVGTKNVSLKLFKFTINSVLLRKEAQFSTFDIGNLYLDTPMQKPESVKIQFYNIPREFVDTYNLTMYVHNGRVYFEIIRSAYGLPQSVILANTLLHKQLEKEGYYETQARPGLWRHKWRPIMFCLIVDYFSEWSMWENNMHITWKMFRLVKEKIRWYQSKLGLKK